MYILLIIYLKSLMETTILGKRSSLFIIDIRPLLICQILNKVYFVKVSLSGHSQVSFYHIPEYILCKSDVTWKENTITQPVSEKAHALDQSSWIISVQCSIFDSLQHLVARYDSFQECSMSGFSRTSRVTSDYQEWNRCRNVLSAEVSCHTLSLQIWKPLRVQEHPCESIFCPRVCERIMTTNQHWSRLL